VSAGSKDPAITEKAQMIPNPNLQGGTFATNTGLLTATGAETVYDTTVTIDYCINGQAYRKTAVTDGATPTTDGNTGSAFNAVLPDQACVVVWALNSSGTVSCYQGAIVDVDGDTDALEAAAQFPGIPDSVCPFAYSLVQTAGTAAAAGFIFGTSNWNATGVTVTTRNLLVLPNNPIAS
jgi:hypothetical protein